RSIRIAAFLAYTVAANLSVRATRRAGRYAIRVAGQGPGALEPITALGVRLTRFRFCPAGSFAALAGRTGAQIDEVPVEILSSTSRREELQAIGGIAA
ncbi:MAG: hypothetical protein AB7G88_06830, partial [Thermomicrobiales bacterium]